MSIKSGTLHKHTRWLWLKNYSNLSAKQQGELHQLMRPSAQLATARALRWREDFQAFYDQDPSYAPEYLRRWCYGAKRSRLQPIKDFVTLVERHWDARHRLARQPPEQRPARRNQLPGPGSQSPSPRLPQQRQDDHNHLPHCRQAPTTHRHQPQARVHALTLSNPLKTAKSPHTPQWSRIITAAGASANGKAFIPARSTHFTLRINTNIRILSKTGRTASEIA